MSDSDIKNGKITYGETAGDKKNKNTDPVRLKIVQRAAKEVKDGMNINLGIGIPTLLPGVLPKDINIYLQSENGVMGVGPYPTL